MARFFSLAGLIVMGLIAGDIITHGSDVKDVASGVNTIDTPIISGLLGG